MARPSSILTLGDMIDANYWLAVHCGRNTPPCYHHAEVDVMWLAGRVGRAYPCDHWSLLRIGWRCTACGSREVSFRSATKWTGPIV